MTHWPVHARIDGPIVMIGFGSIGKGTLPLIERHFNYDKSRFVVIDPEDKDRKLLDERGIRFIHEAVTRDNYRELLKPLLTAGGGQGFCVNLSVDTSSLDIMELCRELGALYIDTVIEPWAGFYFDTSTGPEARSNYALRETTLAAKRKRKPGATTAVSCCGANPGMVSWFVKQALLEHRGATPKRQGQGAEDARGMGQACQEARRQGHPHRRARHPARQASEAARTCSSTPGRSRASSRKACSRPSSAGARTRSGCRRTAASTRPAARRRSICCSRAPIRACAPGRRPRGANTASWSRTTSRSRSPTTSRVRDGGKVAYRPTCHYAYHPANDAVLSLHEMFGTAGKRQDEIHILDENEIVDGIDELGVLLYGHKKNAYWYGSQLSIEETRELAPYQNATGLQVTSRGARRHGLGAGKSEGRHRRGRRDGFPPLPRGADALSRPGDRHLYRLDAARRPPGLFPEDIDKRDPWQFKNVLVR